MTTIKARRIGDRQLQLDEPLPAGVEEVHVVLTPAEAPKTLDALWRVLETIPPGNRSIEDIQRQVSEQKESWERSL